MKSQRQEKILELISRYEIETQEDMMARLLDEGFKVTQATVSRDLKELKLTKVQTARGTYRYAVSQARQSVGNVKLNNAMADSIIDVNYSLNNVVIKTYPGLAAAVAFAVDNLNMPSILGCVAGDDTVIIVTKTVEGSAELGEKITELVKNF
jgi:transcriptional regulator of arginine metabolism